MRRDPKKLLNKVTGTIASDIEHIEHEVSLGKLPADSASDLVRYHKVLQEMVNNTNKEKAKAADKFAKMSTEELKKLAKEFEEKRKEKEDTAI